MNSIDTIWESIQGAALELYRSGEIVKNSKWQSVEVEKSMYEVRNLFLSMTLLKIQMQPMKAAMLIGLLPLRKPLVMLAIE